MSPVPIGGAFPPNEPRPKMFHRDRSCSFLCTLDRICERVLAGAGCVREYLAASAYNSQVNPARCGG